MLSQNKLKNITKYWLDGAQESYKTMQYLYKGKRYADCLFYGHLTLEKTLKALVVEKKQELAPYIHNLHRLAEIAQLDLTKEEIALLKEVTGFNMEARYPDEKYSFHVQCNKSFTDHFYKAITQFYKKYAN